MPTSATGRPVFVSMISVKVYGRVPLNTPQKPRFKKLAVVPIDHGDLFRTRHVGKDSLPLLLDNDSLRLARQGNLFQKFSIRNGDNCDTGLFGTHATYIKFFCSRVVLQFI